MTKLDLLVQDCLLAYPTIFSSRWDVIKHLYLVVGNGFEWVDTPDGAVLKTDSHHDSGRNFFRDIIEDEKHLEAMISEDDAGSMWPLIDRRQARIRLKRLKRQFMWDNINLIAAAEHDFDISAKVDAYSLTLMVSTDYSKAFTVPENVEKSFRKGAMEALEVSIRALTFLEGAGLDGGLRDKMTTQLNKLRPWDPEAVKAVMAALKGVKK